MNDHCQVPPHDDTHDLPAPRRITALAITILYLTLSLLWIGLSDTVVALFIPDQEKQWIVSVAKGMAFVSISALIIYMLVSASHKQLLRATLEARNRGEILRNITDNCTAAYFRAIYTPADGNFTISDASSGYLRLPGAPPVSTPLSLREAMACYHEEDRHRLIDTLRAASETLTPLDLEARLNLESGASRWFRIQAAPKRLDAHSIQWDGVLLDIDARLRLDAQRRAAMAMLERVRERLEALLESAISLQHAHNEKQAITVTAEGLVRAGWRAVVVSTLDPDLRVITEAVAGPEAGNILPRVRARTAEQRRQLLDSSKRINPEQIACMTLIDDGDDGPHWRNDDIISIPLRDSRGNLTGLIDITTPEDDKRPTDADLRYIETYANLAAGAIEYFHLYDRQQEAERRQRESEHRLSIHIRETPLVYVESDLDHVIRYFNPAAERLFGWTAQELTDKATWRLLIPEHEMPIVVEQVERQIQRGASFKVTNNNITRDGREITCVWHNTPLVDEHNRVIGLACIGEDVTQQLLYDRKIRQTLNTQRLLTAELDHRVKNALGGLLTLIDFSAERHQSVKDFALSLRNRVQALSTVHSVLSASSWESVDLSALITLMLPPESPGKLHARGPNTEVAPRQLSALGMVIQEFISNAMKHGALGVPNGVVDIEWTVSTDSHKIKDRILHLHWREFGGPTPTPTPTPGLGTQLLEGFSRFELRGNLELNYPPTGAHHRLTAHLDPIDDDAAPDTDLPDQPNPLLNKNQDHLHQNENPQHAH